jgi:hypothetical protein
LIAQIACLYKKQRVFLTWVIDIHQVHVQPSASYVALSTSTASYNIMRNIACGDYPIRRGSFLLGLLQ